MKAWAEAFTIVGVLLCLTTCEIVSKQSDTALKVARIQAECTK